MESIGPVYRIDKLKSKYIILEVMGFAGKSKAIGEILYMSSRMLRELAIRNHKVFRNIVKRTYVPSNPFDFDHTAAEHFGLTLKI